MKKTLTNLVLSFSLALSSFSNISCKDPSYYLNSQSKNHKTKPKTALIIVDSQYGFLHDINRYELESESDNQVEIIRFAKQNNFPIYVLELKNKGKTRKKIRKEISNYPYTKITKPHGSGFDKTNLDDLLKDQDIENVILMGVNASICVLQTAKDASRKDYRVLTSSDIIQDATYFAAKNESLDQYQNLGKLFRTHEDLIDYLKNK
jgi:nicotinamidase-related amidase